MDITFSNLFATDPNSVVFGTSLGDPSNPAETQTTSLAIGTEVLFLAEQSFLADSALDAIQGSTFTLVTMTFTPSETGTYVFSGDDFAGGLFLTDGNTLNPGVNAASVTVMPEPGAPTGIGIGLAVVAFSRRRRRL